MEIKELVKYIQEFKRLRNEFELKVDIFVEEGTKAANEESKAAEDRNRAGLHNCYVSNTDIDTLNKGVGKITYALDYINEGLAILETAHRRAIRYKEPKEEKKSENKEV